MARSTPVKSVTFIVLAIQPAINPATSYTANPTMGLAYTWFIYNDPYK